MTDEQVISILEGIPVRLGPGGVHYVRASDVPSTARPAFEKWAAAIHSLHLPGEQPGDPVPEEDYREWLRTLKPMHPQPPFEREE